MLIAKTFFLFPQEFIHSNGTENDIIIFTKSTKEAENLEKLLESQSIAVLVANEYMMPTQLKDIKLLWENSINTGKFVLGKFLCQSPSLA